jgi:hypothetical protein
MSDSTAGDTAPDSGEERPDHDHHNHVPGGAAKEVPTGLPNADRHHTEIVAGDHPASTGEEA